MKKMLLAVLSVLMVLNGSIGMAQEIGAKAEGVRSERTGRNVISTQGEIVEIQEGMVRIVGHGTYDEVVLHVQGDTYLLSAQDGSPILLKDLKKGAAVTAYYGPALTRSLPPQGMAIALVVGMPESGSGGIYMKVGAVEEKSDGSIRVLCTNNERLVTIRPEILEGISEIKEGSELMVWYEIMTMSIPGQATATKAVLLPGKKDIRVNTIAGVIVTNKRELNLGEHDIIMEKQNTVMLPLRVIAESLGYEILWHNDSNTAQLKKDGHTFGLAIDSKEYNKDNQIIQLDNAPVMVNGTTVVPVEFFTKVMKLNVEVSNQEGFGL